MRLSNRYTTSYGCRDLVERATRPLGHLFLQAIEELARTSMNQVLKLLDGNERFNSQTQYPTTVGFRRKGGDRRSHKQVAMAKHDLNKTQSVCGGYGGI
jgi:hypothetical protein